MKFDLGIIAAWRDIQNYRDWIKTINVQENDLESSYNKFGMSHNITYMVYFILTLPDEDTYLPEKIKRLRVLESLTPVNRYFDDELNFAENLVPEINLIVDEENEPTLNYVIAYRFAFQTLGFWWLIKRSIGLVGLVYLGSKVPWPELWAQIITWISSFF